MKDKQLFVAATLRLFNCVLEVEPACDSFKLIKNYGVIIAPSAYAFKPEILRFLEESKVSSKQMNQTFYASESEVIGKSHEERLLDQILHYFSTYGARAEGIDSKISYIPHNWEEIKTPERIDFSVIVGVSKEELISRCLEMLQTGIALKEETIKDILIVLKECGYVFTGNETIKNKEARVYIYDCTNTLPNQGDNLFRYLVYKATGSSLVVNNLRTLQSIQSSQYILPCLDENKLLALAESFNRRKPYWIAFKKAHKSNSSVVNRISKLSKKAHVPLPQDILGSLTQKKFPEGTVREALKSANIFRVVRAANAVKHYLVGSPGKLYSIRNGKSFVKEGGEFRGDPEVLSLLESDIRSKINSELKVYIPRGLEYAIPTSEKKFSGCVPNYSSLEADCKEGRLLVGVYWENGYRDYVDFDLSCDSLSGSRVGWNSVWSNPGLTYSGDITDAPKGAAEWFSVSSLSEPWLVSVNLYGADGPKENVPFTIMVGYGPRSGKGLCNYFLDPNDLLFSANATAVKRQTILGVLSPSSEGSIKFTLINQAGDNRHVSTPDGFSSSVIESLVPQIDSGLKLNQFVNLCESRAEADIDLSPNKVSKDSILSLLNIT